MTRRGFLLVLFSAPLAAETVIIRRTDAERAQHSEELRTLLLKDIEDMQINKQLGLNLARIKREDHLYAQIQSDRKW